MHDAHVDEAASGQEALEKCFSRESPYDLVLLDLLLPDMDGIAVLKHLRRETLETTVVMLTGAGGITSAIAAVQEGADGYMEKEEISMGGDHTAFIYKLEQAMNRRAGVIAQHQLNEMKAQFYAMFTHDLRSPASTIVLATEMLQTESIGPLNKEQQEAVDTIREAAHKLLTLISEYLDYSRISAKYLRIYPKDQDLRPIVDSCIRLARIQAIAKKQDLTFKSDPDPVVAHVDGERIKQVFDNLINNAIKYTPVSGQITILLTRSADHAVFQIHDTGQGIPADEIPNLFTRYHRIHHANAPKVSGFGLGLAIAKEVVEAHGGHIDVQSAGIGQGATFTVRLPLTPEQVSVESNEPEIQRE
jgi:signal transduction histidine kinase